MTPTPSEYSVPRQYQKLYAKRNTSRKAAIRMACLECVGFIAKEVELCTEETCPLYRWRLKG